MLDDVAAVLQHLTYAGPSDDFSGLDTISVEVTDAGGISASRKIEIEIDASNPPEIKRTGPLASLPYNPRIDEDGKLSLDALEVSVPSPDRKSVV